MKAKITLLIITLGISALTAQGQIQISADYSTFVIKENTSGVLTDSLLEKKINDVTGNFKGGKLILGDVIGIGIGLSTINFQKEIQGFFPQTKQFGIAIIKGSTSYWTFPLSISWSANTRTYRTTCGFPGKGTRNNIRNNTRFELSYMPSIINNSTISSNTLGSATNSSYIINYPDNSKVFQHSIAFATIFQLSLRAVNLVTSPYISIGSKYYKNSGGSSCILNYGIAFSLRLYIPSIYIERSPTYNEYNNKHNEMKKRELQKKQSEIEEKLKNKPK